MWNTVCICVSVYDGYQTQCSAHVKQTFLHWVISKGQKCRNSMISPHHGLPIQGRLMLASYSGTFPGHKPSHFQLLRSWGIALLQTSGIQKCCLVQWASKALTAARWKMFQYKQTSWKPRAAKMQWLLLWPGPPDSPRCELLLSKYLPKERHSVTLTLSKSAEILCGCFLSRMAQLNSMEHRT